MTFFEYEARMYAFRLSSVDEQEKMHMQAWLNHAVTATKENGKPVHKDFESFFNYDKQIRNVTGEVKKVDPRVKRLAEIAKLTNERR